MKFWYNPHFLAVIAFLILSVFALKDLLKPSLYTSHDGETHTARIAQYYLALKDGQFPPRFAGTFYNGLGSPIFIYIYPLPYLMGGLLHFAHFSFVNSFKILMALGFIFSGLFTYLWLNELLKSPKAAFLGALFYTWAPYRFLLIYVRGSLSENIAYAFLPLVLYSLTRLNKETGVTWLAFSAISYSCLMLSQNLVALISTPFIVLYALIFLERNKEKVKNISFLFLALLWGVLISSFTYAPSIFERKFIRFDAVIGSAYASHFASLKQIIYSPWGYGFDLPGTVNDSLSLQLGLAHILMMSLAIILLFCILMKKLKFGTSIIKLFFYESEKVTDYLLIFSILTVFVTLFLTVQSTLAVYVWDKIKVLQIIDIPWRLLGLSTLGASLTAAIFIKHAKSGIVFLILIAFIIVANRNHLRINKSVPYEDGNFLKYYGSATYYSEFNPAWRGSDSVPTTLNPNEKYKILSGQADIETKKITSSAISFSVNVDSENANIRINKSYFPGLIVKDNGNKLDNFSQVIVPKSSDLKVGDDYDNIGLIQLKLSRGIHKINVKFGETALRKMANIVSLGSFLLALGLLVKFRHAKVY